MNGDSVGTPLKHPLIAQLPAIVAMGGYSAKAPAYSLQSYEGMSDLNSQFWLGIIIRSSGDGQWFVFPERKLSPLTNKDAFFSHLTAAEIQAIHYLNSPQTILPLATLLQKFSNKNFYIHIDQPRIDVAIDDLMKLLKEQNLLEHVVVTSPFADTTKALREKSYDWLVGASTSEAATFRMWTSMYLESVATSPFEAITLDSWNPRQLIELERRHKIVFLQTDDPAKVGSLFKDKKVSIVTSRPDLAK